MNCRIQRLPPRPRESIKKESATVLIDPEADRISGGMKESQCACIGAAAEIRDESRLNCSAQTDRILSSEKELKNSTEEIISLGSGTGSDKWNGCRIARHTWSEWSAASGMLN